MRALLVILAACGGSAAPPPMAPAPAPPPPPAAAPIVATNDPAPAPVAGDPCEGGQVAPADAPSGIGTGGYGTIGGGGNACGGRGYGVGGGPPRKRGHGPVVHFATADVSGALDKAIIRRYMKRNQQKINKCYEDALATSPKLAGTVTTKFEIGADGLVTKSEATGMPGVDSCIAAIIKQIEFPKPKDGAAVTVSYPFTLAPTGD